VIDAWRNAGAEILHFSPLADEPPPERADSCWLPGGYPELHAQALANAAKFPPDCAVLRKRGRSTASAAATWFWASVSKMRPAGAIP
jgi:cobyrinic acid a,c-diamide synthase